MPFFKAGLMRRPRTEENPTLRDVWAAIRIIQSHQAAQASTLSTALTELGAVNVGISRALGGKYRPIPRGDTLCAEQYGIGHLGPCALGEGHLGNHVTAMGHQWADGRVIP